MTWQHNKLLNKEISFQGNFSEFIFFSLIQRILNLTINSLFHYIKSFRDISTSLKSYRRVSSTEKTFRKAEMKHFGINMIYGDGFWPFFRKRTHFMHHLFRVGWINFPEYYAVSQPENLEFTYMQSQEKRVMIFARFECHVLFILLFSL